MIGVSEIYVERHRFSVYQIVSHSRFFADLRVPISDS
jgi:hypothetical protein